MKPLNPPIDDWRGQSCWLVGASSGIGEATARALVQAGARVAISARPSAHLDRLAFDLKGAVAVPVDVGDRQATGQAFKRVCEAIGTPTFVLCNAGIYQPMRATEHDLDVLLQHVKINYVGALHVIDCVLGPMLQQQHGHISLVGSVAGYRGLPQSLAYGPTKAALIHLADVLYLDLHARGLGVSIVNPGFVRTALTAQNTFRMPALISPEEAAQAMLEGWRRGRFEIHFPRRFTQWLKLASHLGDRAYFTTIRRATGT